MTYVSVVCAVPKFQSKTDLCLSRICRVRVSAMSGRRGGRMSDRNSSAAADWAAKRRAQQERAAAVKAERAAAAAPASHYTAESAAAHSGGRAPTPPHGRLSTEPPAGDSLVRLCLCVSVLCASAFSVSARCRLFVGCVALHHHCVAASARVDGSFCCVSGFVLRAGRVPAELPRVGRQRRVRWRAAAFHRQCVLP